MTDPDGPPPGFDPEDLGELMQGLSALAQYTRSCFNAHVQEGFSEQQALVLTIEVMKVQVGSALGGGK